MKTLTLLNVNNNYFFNGERITHQKYVELLNTTFAKDLLFNMTDYENVTTIKVIGV